MDLNLALAEKYELKFKFIHKVNDKDKQKKIVMKIWIVDEDGTPISDEAYHDLIWWDETNFNYMQDLTFTVPPTRMKLKERILWWILLFGFGWSIVFHVVR